MSVRRRPGLGGISTRIRLILTGFDVLSHRRTKNVKTRIPDLGGNQNVYKVLLAHLAVEAQPSGRNSLYVLLRQSLSHFQVRIGVECGQSWYRLDSWRYRARMFRRIPRGFAVGPVMVIRGKW